MKPALGPWLAFLVATLPSTVRAQTITVTLNSAYARSLPANFYGDNGQDRNDFDWQDTAPVNGVTFQSVLKSLNLSLLRLPCGTGSNYWEWQYGTMYTDYQAGSNQDSSKMSELAKEIQESGAQPVLILNLLTQPSTTVSATPQPGELDPSGGPTPASNPDNQLGANGYIATAAADLKALTPSVTLTYIELGNEFYYDGPDSYGGGDDNDLVYPTAADYGTTATSWIDAVHGMGGYQCAAIAAHVANENRQQTWNVGMDTTLQNEDALTLHIYPVPNLPWLASPSLGVSPGALTPTYAEDMLATPFLIWSTMESVDFSGSDAVRATDPVWITEYNLSSKEDTIHYDTWAHGLCLAAMSLKFLEQPRIQMLLHHCVVANGSYADIFDNTTTGLSAVGTSPTVASPWNGNAAPATVPWGLTAGGLVSMHINTAAKGQSSAEELSFSGAPQVSVPNYTAYNGGTLTNTSYPALYGWEFKGAANGQIVILNLSAQPETVNLSGVASSGTYYQITGDPGAYVLDGVNSTAVSFSGQTDNLIETSGPLTTSASFSLPEFSITRLVVNPPSLLSAASSMTQGAAGTFALPVAWTATSSAPAAPYPVECREPGSLNLVLTFDKTMASAQASLGSGTATVGTPVCFGTQVEVPLSGVANAQTLVVDLANVTGADGSVLPAATVGLRVLLGDVNSDGVVNISDINLVRAASGTAVSASNFQDDLNADGAINISDINLVRAASGTGVP